MTVALKPAPRSAITGTGRGSLTTDIYTSDNFGKLYSRRDLSNISRLHFQSAKVPYGEKGAEFFKFAHFDNNTQRYKIISA